MSLLKSLKNSLLDWQMPGGLIDLQAGHKYEVIGRYQFDHDFPAFNGHFPEKPVLPAVAQLAAVRVIVEKAVGSELRPFACQRVKFVGVIEPLAIVDLLLTLEVSDDLVQVEFTITVQGDLRSSGNLDFTEID